MKIPIEKRNQCSYSELWLNEMNFYGGYLEPFQRYSPRKTGTLLQQKWLYIKKLSYKKKTKINTFSKFSD